MNPVNWWHKQEGGKIAEERPAPPGADAPYPNMATVPARPEAPDAAALKNLTDSLVADRTNAQHAAEAAPLADPSQPSTSPGLFGVGTAPPPPPPGPAPAASAGAAPAPAVAASASMPAVTAPPEPAQPPAPAPRKAVQSAPLAAVPEMPAAPAPAAAPPEPAQAAAPPPPAAAAAPAPAATTPVAAPAAQPQPDLPVAPPPRPAGAAAPPPVPVVPPPMPAPPGISSASIVFIEGTASLSPPAADEVKAFAAKRGNGVIAVTGYGDAPAASDPAQQSAALTLGLARAQSVFDVLKAAGVPTEAIRVNAEASGRGAALRLLQ
jgi:outer membrane protein OmpA-like peptidoglycan-associated protein